MRRLDEVEEELLRPPRRPLWEYFVIIPVVALSLMVTVSLFRKEMSHVRQMMLRQQLLQIRSGILVYHALNHMLPSDLRTLAYARTVAVPGGESFPLVEGIGFNGNGEAVDSLGYPLRYNPSTGRVASTAPCCQYW